MAKNLILKDSVSTGGICKPFQTPRTVCVLGLVPAPPRSKFGDLTLCLAHCSHTGRSQYTLWPSLWSEEFGSQDRSLGWGECLSVADSWPDLACPKNTVGSIRSLGLIFSPCLLLTTTTVFPILAQQKERKGRHREHWAAVEKTHGCPAGQRGGSRHAADCYLKKEKLSCHLSEVQLGCTACGSPPA